LLLNILSPAVFEILHSKGIGVTSLSLQGHVTSSVTWPFDSRWPFPIVRPWNQVSISNGFRGIRDIQWRMWRNSWHDLETTSKRRSRSFILVPINFSYATMGCQFNNFLV